AVRPEQQPAMIALERLAEFDLGCRLTLGGEPAPGRVELIEGVPNDLAFFGFHFRHAVNLIGSREKGDVLSVHHHGLLPAPFSRSSCRYLFTSRYVSQLKIPRGSATNTSELKK